MKAIKTIPPLTIAQEDPAVYHLPKAKQKPLSQKEKQLVALISNAVVNKVTEKNRKL